MSFHLERAELSIADGRPYFLQLHYASRDASCGIHNDHNRLPHRRQRPLGDASRIRPSHPVDLYSVPARSRNEWVGTTGFPVYSARLRMLFAWRDISSLHWQGETRTDQSADYVRFMEELIPLQSPVTRVFGSDTAATLCWRRRSLAYSFSSLCHSCSYRF